MSQVKLAPPQPLELVPADEVFALIGVVDQEVTDLERRAAEATAAADHAEERAEALGLDEHASTWAMASLQRFLNTWRDEVDAETSAILEGARHGARMRLDEAHAEAARVRRAHAAGPVVALTPTVPASGPHPTAEGPDVAPAPVVVAPEGVEPVVVEPVKPPAAVALAPVVVVAPPSTNGGGVPATEVREGSQHLAWAPTTDDISDEMFGAPRGAVAAAPASAEPAAAPANTTRAPEKTAENSDREFWPEQPAAKRKGFLRRIPVSAVLEVLAVILILVFILLRLS